MQRQRHQHTIFQFGNIYFCDFTIVVDDVFADGAVHNDFVSATICWQFNGHVRKYFVE